MPRDRMDDFDRHFDRQFTSTRRFMGFGMIIAVVWYFFVMGAIGTGLWLLGRWTGVW